MRKVLAAALVAVAMMASGVARAERFQEVAAKAIPVNGPEALAALFWAATVDCSKTEDDLLRRQCEGVKAARADVVAGQTYIMDAEPGAFFADDWDETKKGLPIGLRGCLACNAAVDVGGERRYVTTRGNSIVAGGALKGPEVHKAVRSFKDKKAADRWKDVVVPRIRTQIVFKVPARTEMWTNDGGRGFAVEMLAFRVYDPCDGAMICADPPSAQEAADKAACKGGLASGTDIEEVEVKPIKKEPPLPEALTTYQIKQNMQATAAPQVNACFATYGVPGRADLQVEIGNDGKVKEVQLTGDFEETPTGDCIIKAVKDTEFPKFKRSSMTVPYLFILR